MSHLSLFSADPVVDELFRTFLRPSRWESPTVPAAAQAIPVDVNETDDAYTVKAEIPGVRKEDISLHIEGNKVSLSAEVNKQTEEKKGGRVLRAERYTGVVRRQFTLAAPVDQERATATYENGVLDLVLPKRNTKESTRVAIN